MALGLRHKFLSGGFRALRLGISTFGDVGKKPHTLNSDVVGFIPTPVQNPPGTRISVSIQEELQGGWLGQQTLRFTLPTV